MINLEELENKILSSKEDKIKLRKALKSQMFTDNYISCTDTISLIYFLCDLYKINPKEFDDIYLKDIKEIGYKILED